MPQSVRPWIGSEVGQDTKKHAPATLRNRRPIIDILHQILPETGHVLEIASGSGEHVVAFAQAFPKLDWQPSDSDPACRRSIAAWSKDSGLENIAAPLALDASSPHWPIEKVDALLCINMIHIAPWSATEGLFTAAGNVLASGAPLYLYGPFKESDAPLAQSNAAFDESLRSRNPQWGLRDLEVTIETGESAGLKHERTIAMPANNLSVVFRKS